MKKRILISFLIVLFLFVGVAGRLAYLAGGREIAQYTSVTGSRVEMGPARTLSAPTTASASPALWQHTTEIVWVSCPASVHPH